MRSHALLDELQWRGLLHQHTEAVGDALHDEQLVGYVGFDPTATSLHLGNLLPVMDLVHLQRHGHKPVALVGGGTGLIGDPSGRSNERVLASPETIATNAEHIHKQLERFLDFTGSNAATMINNAEWLVELKAVEFMRDVGKHFTVNYMLQKDSVQSRMDAGISYTEFSYMLLQAYDYLELNRRHGVKLQMGGSDQWGNITAGIELIRRTLGREAHAITSPLVTTASGAKFGKSASGAIWLDPTLTSPYKFYQFLVNVDDRDAAGYLKRFTVLPRTEMEALEQAGIEHPETRDVQRALAREVTRMVHGEAIVSPVEDATKILFGGSLLGLSADALAVLKTEIPYLRTDNADWRAISSLIELLVGPDRLFESKKDAKRAIQQGGFYVNGERIGPEQTHLPEGSALFGRYLLAKKGARNYMLIEIQSA